MSAGAGDTGGQRDIPRAIAWYDGMPLYPHQFLETELRAERLLAYHAALLSPYHWGVRRLEMDESALAAKTFSVREIDAVMPDGLAVCHSSSRDEPLWLPLEPPPANTSVRVYLAVMRAGPADAQQLASGGAWGDQGNRYRRQAASSSPAPGRGEIAYSNATPEDEAADPPRLHPRLTLSTQRPGAEHVSLPIAELRHEPGRGFYRTDYVPPVFLLEPAGPAGKLLAELSGLVEAIRRQASQLLDQAEHASLSSEGNRVAELKQKARALAAAWPALDVALRSGAAGPHVSYLALAAAAGSAAGASDDTLRRLLDTGLPAYEHEDLRACVGAVTGLLKEILDRTLERRFAGYVLAYDAVTKRYSIAARDLPTDWHTGQLVLEARRAASGTLADCRAWMDDARICSEGHLTSLAKRRLTGLGRQLKDSVGDELYESADLLFFELASQDRAAFVTARDGLSVLHPKDLDLGEPSPSRPEELRLLVERKDLPKARPVGSSAYRFAR